MCCRKLCTTKRSRCSLIRSRSWSPCVGPCRPRGWAGRPPRPAIQVSVTGQLRNIGHCYSLATQHWSVLQASYATLVSVTGQLRNIGQYYRLATQHMSVLQARSTKQDKSYRLDLQSMNVTAPSSKIGQVLQARPGKQVKCYRLFQQRWTNVTG